MQIRVSSRGVSLLEFTLAFIVVMVLLFGGVNVSNIIRAKTAAREGVRAALRCLTPTDGGCVQTQITNDEPLYNVYEDRTQFQREVEQQEVVATALQPKLLLPEYALEGFSFDALATRIDPAYTAFIEGTVEERVGRYQYLLRALPAASIELQGEGEDAVIRSASVFDPRGRTREERRWANTIPLLGGGESVLRSGVTKTVSFQISKEQLAPSGAEALSCFTKQLESITLAELHGSQRESSIACAGPSWGFSNAARGAQTLSQRTQLTQKSYVILAIHGQAKGTGSVALEIAYDGTKRSLGGQRFSSEREIRRDFVPRGVPEGSFQQHRDAYQEAAKYEGSLLLPLDTPITLTFTMEGGDPRAFYRLLGAEIYLPRYTVEQSGEYPCYDDKNCTIAVAVKDGAFSTTATTVSLIQRVGMIPVEGCFRNIDEAQKAVASLGDEKGTVQLRKREGACSTQVFISRCGPNHGVSGRMTTEEFITNSEEAERLCPSVVGSVLSPAPNGYPGQTAWTTETRSVELQEPVVFHEVSTCSAPASHLFSSISSQFVSDYPGIREDSLRFARTGRFSGEIDPDPSLSFAAIMEGRESRYNGCERRAVERKVSAPLPLESGCQWRESALEALQLSPSQQIIPESIVRRGTGSWRILEGEPAACDPWRWSRSPTTERTLLQASVPESEVSALCTGRPCSTELVGNRGGGTTMSVNYELAEARALAAMKHSLNEVAFRDGEGSFLGRFQVQTTSTGFEPRISVAVPLYPFGESLTHVAYGEFGQRESFIAEAAKRPQG